jgi:uncharacterized lipoprotein YehR (DUF1307 family)
MKIFKKLLSFVLVLIMFGFFSCSGCQRSWKTTMSEFGNGLDRTITVFNDDGSVHAQFEGKIDVQSSEGGKVLFDFKGKRYVYYNYKVDVIEK